MRLFLIVAAFVSLSVSAESPPSQSSFVRTSMLHPWDTPDFNLACTGEFGTNATIADTQEILSFVNHKGFDEFFIQAGMAAYDDTGWVTHNGAHLYSGGRHYLANRHDGVVPSGWAVHDDVGAYTISLGSWNTDRPALCLKSASAPVAADMFGRTLLDHPWNSPDFDAACADEFGSDSFIAEWADIAAFVRQYGSDTFFEQSGMTTYRASAWVINGGLHLYDSNRHFLIERHDGAVPGGWLLHDHISAHVLDVGSWNTDRPIICAIADADADGDGVADTADNCTLVANADQRDTNGDSYGNACDPDLDNNGVVNFADIGLWVPFFNTATAGDADFNGDGLANFGDYSIFLNYFLQPPGPSGVTPIVGDLVINSVFPSKVYASNNQQRIIVKGEGFLSTDQVWLVDLSDPDTSYPKTPVWLDEAAGLMVIEANFTSTPSGWRLRVSNQDDSVSSSILFDVVDELEQVPFLGSPIDDLTCASHPCDPNEVNISSVVDHSGTPLDAQNSGNWTPTFGNGVVTAFTREVGDQISDGSTYPGYTQVSGERFIVNGHYTGVDNAHYLNYDGHAGFDFPYAAPAKIVAAEEGYLFKATTDNVIYGSAWQNYHAFYILHENGMSTWYLHANQLDSSLSDLLGSDNDQPIWVDRGQLLGTPGNFGTAGVHLHFELRKGLVEIVDPYAEIWSFWSGEWYTGGNTGFTVQINGFVGTITAGGSGQRPNGTELLNITAVNGLSFVGQHRFSDLSWVDVSGEYVDGQLNFEGGGFSWSWARP